MKSSKQVNVLGARVLPVKGKWEASNNAWMSTGTVGFGVDSRFLKCVYVCVFILRMCTYMYVCVYVYVKCVSAHLWLCTRGQATSTPQ